MQPSPPINNGDKLEVTSIPVQQVPADDLTWNSLSWHCLNPDCKNPIDHEDREGNKALCRLCGSTYDVSVSVRQIGGPRPITPEELLKDALSGDFKLDIQIQHPAANIPGGTSIHEAQAVTVVDAGSPRVERVDFAQSAIAEYLPIAASFGQVSIYFREKQTHQASLQWPPPAWSAEQKLLSIWIIRSDAGITSASWTQPA